MSAKTTTLKPNPLYGWDPAEHEITARCCAVVGTVRVYSIRDHGTRIGWVASRTGHRPGARQWASSTQGGSDVLLKAGQTWHHDSRHDAVLSLLREQA